MYLHHIHHQNNNLKTKQKQGSFTGTGGTNLTWFHLKYICSNKSVSPPTSLSDKLFTCNNEKLRGAYVQS